MFELFAMRRLASIAAAAALSAGCSIPQPDVEGTRPPMGEVRVRTPLVDDDGWPMPADGPPADTPHAANAQPRLTR